MKRSLAERVTYPAAMPTSGEQLLQFFDPDAEIAVTERRLPHWAQAGTLCFLTWRTWDSIPQQVLSRWLSDRASWLARHGIDPLGDGWRNRLAALPSAARSEFHRSFADRWHAMLDECQGECVLRRPELGRLVAASLRHFDEDRYTLTDFVVMPNHVHILAVFPDEQTMLAQCENWKHYTAVRINKALGRVGRFWQVDGSTTLFGAELSSRQFGLISPPTPPRPGSARVSSLITPGT